MMISDFCKTKIEFSTLEGLRCLILNATKKTLLLSSKSVYNLLNLNGFQNENVLVFTDTSPNPTQENIVDLFKNTLNFSPECVIAIGGGSVIDLAKAYLAFFKFENKNSQNVLECLKSGKMFYDGKIDFIAVPSSAGTGSDVTQWATIWDSKSPNKYSIDHPCLKPNKSILVPEFIVHAPKQFVLATVFDALSHAVEAFWAKSTNPLVQEIALSAIRLIGNNLQKFLKSPDIEIATELYCASTLAGLAFSQTRTTAAHAISYPLTQIYKIPHGFAVALLLPKIFEINLECGFLGSEKLLCLINELGGLESLINNSSLGIQEMRLSAFGVEKNDFYKIVENVNLERLSNNPSKLTLSQIIEILNYAY